MFGSFLLRNFFFLNGSSLLWYFHQYCTFLGGNQLVSLNVLVNKLCSVRHECWRSSLDGSKQTGTKGWVPQCYVTLCRNAAPCAALLRLSRNIQLLDFVEVAQGGLERLVSLQIFSQETSWGQRRTGRLPQDMMKKKGKIQNLSGIWCSGFVWKHFLLLSCS